jgi:transposase InsO family protein
MPWQERNVVEIRKDFVIRAIEPDCNFSELCREFQISRQQGYKWLKRFKEKGVAGLKDRSRAPHSQALTTNAEVVFEILDWKRAHPRWGPDKIQAKLVAVHANPPSVRTVARILKRAGLVKKRRNRAAPVERANDAPKSDATRPNQLWTVDFKGWWLTGDRRRCEPLTIRDQASRFVFVVQILPSTATVYVREVFEELFDKYGLPDAILSDNGSPFGCTRALGGFTRLSAWFVSLGIEVRFNRPGCPQDNGAHERMHRDIRFDLEDNPSGTLPSQQAACDTWRNEFNNVRPHAALEMRTPQSVYRKSTRPHKPQLFIGNQSVSLRRVITNGGFWWQGDRVPLGRAFVGYDVGIEVLEDGWCRVWFFDQDLGYFDPKDDDLRVRCWPADDKLTSTKMAEVDELATSQEEAA